MADVVVHNNVYALSELGNGGGSGRLLVDVSSSVLYAFFRDVNEDFVYEKSTDGGQTWGSPVAISSTAAGTSTFSVWFDKWTSGDSGTKIWTVYYEGTTNEVRVRSLDTASDTLGTAVTIVAAANGGNAFATTHITKDRGGYIFVAYSVNAAADEGFYRSTDGGGSFGSRASPWEASTEDGIHCRLLPANLADAHDLWLLYSDDSANAWSLKTYDDSADSWSEQSITLTTVLGNSTRQADAAIRHSDGHMIVAINTHIDNAAADLAIFDIDGASSITRKTDIITNADDWASAAIYINQNNGELFVGWLGNPNGSETWTATVTPWFSRSTDGGATWSSPAQYSEDAADDYRGLWTSHSSPGNAAGRFALMWFDDDDNDIFYGYTNSVVIAAGGKSVAAAAGSYAITGTAATLKVARKVVAAAGSYAITGSAATLRRGVPIVAGAGSYALTGSAAALVHAAKLTAGAGSYAVTGANASLLHGVKLAAAAGSYAISGQAATLRRNLPIAAGAGAYAITGAPASLLHQWRIGAGAGSYAITGVAATLVHAAKLAAAGGSYAITGSDASLLTVEDKAILAGVGSYAFNGSAATLTLQRTLSAGAGAYTISGSDADLITVGPGGGGDDIGWLVSIMRTRFGMSFIVK